jgi:pimeloyl-ACP methyl ester carboxylesterase
MTTQDFVNRLGYPIETYNTETSDGYTLEFHRIPHGVKNTNTQNRIPVLLLSHLMSSGTETWVFNAFANQSLAFELAEAGYDVWLGNLRGTAYTLKHKTMTGEMDQFWKYSMDELGRIDVTTMIDYIIDKTGHPKIFLGSTEFSAIPSLIAFITKPEYNEKVFSYIALSPFWDLGEDRVKDIAHAAGVAMSPFIEYCMNHMRGDFFRYPEIPKAIGRWIAKLSPTFLRGVARVVSGGYATDSYNATRAPVYKSYIMSGFSTIPINHVIRMFALGRWEEYDWGPAENMRRYGRENTELHDLSKVTVPTLLVYGKNDLLMGPPEAKIIANGIQNPVMFEIERDDWVGLHFMIATDAKTVYIDRVIDFMNKAANK